MERSDTAGWTDGLVFERVSALRRGVKAALVHPLANYMPAALLRWVLRVTESELAAANWADPGGWRSMVISYDGKPRQIADKVLVSAGTMSMALRNRRLLGARALAKLIDAADTAEPAHVLCLGAGPGCIISDAMLQARRPSRATLVDLSADAFDYGRSLADRLGLSDRMRFVQGDVRDVAAMLDGRVDLVKMLGICEYLPDDVVVSIARAVHAVMPGGASIVLNSLSPAHGTDRFFRRVFGLHMIHRDASRLRDLMGQAGFGNFTTLREPLGVYDVIIGST
ncbi:MAG: methyltransferase domain-containing protein [Phycisphaerae bacterium]|nr:methyltransferase domain-containing protein [Phycisphaerae bacterium]